MPPSSRADGSSQSLEPWGQVARGTEVAALRWLRGETRRPSPDRRGDCVGGRRGPPGCSPPTRKPLRGAPRRSAMVQRSSVPQGQRWAAQLWWEQEQSLTSLDLPASGDSTFDCWSLPPVQGFVRALDTASKGKDRAAAREKSERRTASTPSNQL